MQHFILTKAFDQKVSGPRTLGVDFDGTIVDVSHPLKPFSETVLKPGAKETLIELKRQGWFIIIDTCRADKAGIARYLKEHGVPFDTIGVNPFAPPDVCKDKLFADVKIDDKVTQFRGWENAVKDINTTYEKHQREIKNGK